MPHKPIFLHEIGLHFLNKTLFTDFSAQISPHSRIDIIGKNGSGKSCLLKILSGLLKPSSGEVSLPSDLTIGYVEQTITEFDNLSGGERFNKRL